MDFEESNAQRAKVSHLRQTSRNVENFKMRVVVVGPCDGCPVHPTPMPGCWSDCGKFVRMWWNGRTGQNYYDWRSLADELQSHFRDINRKRGLRWRRWGTTRMIQVRQFDFRPTLTCLRAMLFRKRKFEAGECGTDPDIFCQITH